MIFFDKLKGLFGGRPEPISCGDALKLVHEFLDGELEDVSAAEVELHFEVCQRCYPHLRLERCFREAVRRAAGRETAPPELRERLSRMIAEADSES